MSINLKLYLADGTTVDGTEIRDKIRNFSSLCEILNQEAVIHPTTHDWNDTEQSFYEAERDNEEDKNGNAGAYLPYNRWGELVRDLDKDEQDWLDENDYYYQVAEVDWQGDTDFESFVGKWMNEEPEALIDVITNGCVVGTVSELNYNSDIRKCYEKYKGDIEAKYRQVSEDIGGMNSNSLAEIVWTAFEETVRETLQTLQLEDI